MTLFLLRCRPINKPIFAVVQHKFCSTSNSSISNDEQQYLTTPKAITNKPHLSQKNEKSVKNPSLSAKVEKLNQKWRKFPSLPTYKNDKISPGNVIEGNSKLLKSFSDKSDIYIQGVTPFKNRKYVPLIEQCNNINRGLDEYGFSQKLNIEDTINEPNNHDVLGLGDEMFAPGHFNAKIDQYKGNPMTTHENWNLYFRNENTTLYNECETWNVISHINKRHSYGKSLRYSDRFYRNWAIRKAKEEDLASHKSRENAWSRDTF